MQTQAFKSFGMARKVLPDPLDKTVSFRVTDDDYATVESIMARERRKESEVCRALLLRGTAAYKRDGLLFEPAGESRRIPEGLKANEADLVDERRSDQLRKTPGTRTSGGGRKR